MANRPCAPFHVLALALTAALPAWACRENLVRPRGPVASVTLTPDSATLLRGDSAQFVATARNAAGSPLATAAVTWATSDSTVATARQTGLVRAVAPGVATITATSDSHSATARVAVLPRVTAIRVVPHDVALVRDGSFPLTAQGLDESTGSVTSLRGVAWASSDPGVAAVAATGVVTAVADGDAWVRAQSESLRDSARIRVQVVRFTQVSAGPYQSTCGTGPGGAFCWGYDGFSGNLGTGALVDMVLTPVRVSGGDRFVFVSAGDAFGCGITGGGAAWCWGDGTYGRRGDGRPDTAVSSPVPVAGNQVFQVLSAGRRHACGLTSQGDAWCWGGNSTGAIGLPTSTEMSTVPVPAQESLVFTFVGAGFLHTCALDAEGIAQCWGRGFQLGDSVGVSRHQAAPVAGGHRFRMLSVGWNHTCGLTADSTAWCWGFNLSGEAGVAAPSVVLVPTAVASAPRFASIHSGYSSTCGLTSAGAAYCWGSNNAGQLGTGDTLSGPAPRPAAGALRFTAVSLGNAHACGLGVDALLYCWGSAEYGMLGNGARSGSVAVPTPVSGQVPVAAPRKR